MITQRAKQELPGRLAEDKMPRFNCTVSEVTVMNLQPAKKPTPVIPADKKGKGLRSPSFHRSAPNLSETLSIPEGTNTQAEITPKEGVSSSKPFYAGEAQSMDNLALKRPVKLAPLEIPLEVKEAQLKKIMSIQRDAQLAAFKLASVGSFGSEPHVKRVKNVPQLERENFPKSKTFDSSTLQNKGSIHSLSVAKSSCEIQIILPTEENAKPAKIPTNDESPMPCRKPLIPQNNLQALDSQKDMKISENSSQGTGRRRFTLKQMKEQQELMGKSKPLKATGVGLEESKTKTASQRAHKTLSEASRLINTLAKKHRGPEEDQDEADDDLLTGRLSSRRMAVGDVIQADEE
uniref:Uncharacterized protein n=1 Tax=Pogona vitticeps TaxID=103695 RepID=A0A6J0UHK5_9SAUR